MKKAALLALCVSLTLTTMPSNSHKKSKELAWIKTIGGSALMVYGLIVSVRGALLTASLKTINGAIANRHRANNRVPFFPILQWMGPAVTGYGITVMGLGYYLVSKGCEDFEDIAEQESLQF